MTFTSHKFYVAGHHAPAKPTLSVLGRHEIQVEWDIPKEPLSRITSYEVKVNGEVWQDYYMGVWNLIIHPSENLN
jgi:hypothetical protein